VKRTSLRRKTPLERGARPSPRRKKPRRSGRKLDPIFLEIARTLPCLAIEIDGHSCWGPTDPDHLGPHPLGRKADDDTAAPLCRGAHTERTDYPGPSSGIFRGWSGERMLAWKGYAIAKTRADVARILATRA
jgi:hypothetical protein